MGKLKISQNNLRMIIILGLITALFYLHKQAESYVKSVSYWQISGSIYNVNTSIELNVSNELPLVSYKPLPTTSQSSTDIGNSVSDDIFFTPTKKEKIIEIIEVQAPVEPQIDYDSLIADSIHLVSISNTGAIINKRFTRFGTNIIGVKVPSADGASVPVKLVKADSKNKSIYIAIENKYYTVRLK